MDRAEVQRHAGEREQRARAREARALVRAREAELLADGAPSAQAAYAHRLEAQLSADAAETHRQAAELQGLHAHGEA